MKTTDKYIEEKLLMVLEDMPIEKVSVQMLCKLANISRQTLYYHYGSLIDVFVSWFENEISEILRVSGTYHTWVQAYLAMLQLCKDNKKAILHVYNSNYREKLLESLQSMGVHIIQIAIRQISADLGVPILHKDEEFMVEYYMYVFMGILEKYMQNEMTEDIEFIGSRCEIMMGNSIKEKVQAFFEVYKS